MDEVKKSLAYVFTEKYLSIAIQLGSMMVVSRLLTPTDIGLFSVSAAAIGIAQVMREFGVGSYLVQERELTPARLGSAFAITLGMALLLFTLLQAAAGPVAGFYSEPRMEGVLRLLSINFLMIPIGAVSLSMLKRDMRFDLLFRVRMAALVLSTATVVGGALAGLGVLALVYGSLVNAAATAIGASLARRSQGWIRPHLGEWRRVLGYGTRATAAGVATEIATRANDLVVGRVLGMAPVAILSRAEGAMQLLNRNVLDAIKNVAYPAFAKADRAGGAMEDIHARTVNAVTALAWPFYAGLALFAPEAIYLLFGPQWGESAGLVPVFCLAGALAATWKFNLALVQAVGRIDIVYRYEILNQVIRVAILFACVLYFETLAAVAWGFALSCGVALLLFYRAKGLVIANDWPRRVRDAARNILLTGVTLVPALAARLWFMDGGRDLDDFVVLGVAVALCVLAWVLAIRWLDHPVAADPMMPTRLRRWLSRSLPV